ncbi:CbiX/SirB N-terminal domain-containing protein [Metasolibacillus meyeri]|uniref:CbiX/SirB N-terminal domain-containing protein n=1 Tax=Metasolibacillus meyeri TaxID=1071052 RepID=A0AAW9NI74_9BACL|nr:CbiX/SirB N-terminal domain-containing protein [Metasolibacillus meyeri]MEC1177120.1 CbiX/SirB N-terminal domain-containing protein [Metasolibacillus meyeri]
MTTWNLQKTQRHLLICNGATCLSAGGEEVTQAIRREIAEHKLDEEIHTSRTRCNGRCKDKCVVISYPDATWYHVPNDEVARAVVHEEVEEENIIYRLGAEGTFEHNDKRETIQGIHKYKRKKKAGEKVKKAILFVGHGSKLEAGNEEVRQFVERTRYLIDPSFLVETCFLEFAAPDIEEGIENCVEKGAEEVHVVPIILLHAGHSKLHIPAEIEHAREHFPHITFTYGQTIGIHDKIFKILLARLEEIGFDTEGQHPDTTILFIARGSSDAGAKADFYKITQLLAEKLHVKSVECAFMGVTTPTVPDGIEHCVKSGAKRIVMLPYFLFTGILMERMKKMREQFGEVYPDVAIDIAGYFGYHPELQHVLVERAEQAINGTSTGMQDLENYREYARIHGPVHHQH